MNVTGHPHDKTMIGKMMRLPSMRSASRQRVLVKQVEDLYDDEGSVVLVTGLLAYAKTHPTNAGNFRGRFVTILRADDVIEEDQ